MKWLTLLFILFIILIIVLADTGNLGMVYWITRLPYADKAGHFFLYGILALLIDLTLFRARPAERSRGTSRRRVAVISGLILALLIGLEEFSQQYFADRTFSLMDVGASYLGVISFSWLAVKVGVRYSAPTV